MAALFCFRIVDKFKLQQFRSGDIIKIGDLYPLWRAIYLFGEVLLLSDLLDTLSVKIRSGVEIDMMELIDNKQKTLRDDLAAEIKKDSRISIAAATFSIYAFQ